VIFHFLVPMLQRGNAYHPVSSYRINGIAKSGLGSHGGPWEPENRGNQKKYRIIQDRLFKSDFDKLLEQQQKETATDHAKDISE